MPASGLRWFQSDHALPCRIQATLLKFMVATVGSPTECTLLNKKSAVINQIYSDSHTHRALLPLPVASACQLFPPQLECLSTCRRTKRKTVCDPWLRNPLPSPFLCKVFGADSNPENFTVIIFSQTAI